MIAKIVAILSLLALPFSASMWYRSHRDAGFHRYDLTLYKSVWVYLQSGVCGIEVLSMPTKTASRSEFHTPLGFDPMSKYGSFELTSQSNGPFHTLWVVFPLWLPTLGLALMCFIPMVHGPGRRWWRARRGCCIVCGYSLFGNKTGRCPECGMRVARSAR